jgi:hypothetical protein
MDAPNIPPMSCSSASARRAPRDSTIAQTQRAYSHYLNNHIAGWDEATTIGS